MRSTDPDRSELSEALSRDGYAIVRGFMSPDEVAGLACGFDRLLSSEYSPSAYCVAGSPAAAVPLGRRLGATCFSTPPSLLHRVPASLRRYGAS